MTRITNTIRIIGVVILFLLVAPANAEVNKPEHFLFKINRSRDADEIWYTVNLNKLGIPDNKTPINAYWVRRSKNNETEPLTRIQNKYAYGIRIIQPYSKQHEQLKFQFVSFSEQTFELRKTASGKFKVFTYTENNEIEVARIFVQINGGSFWLPSIPFVKLSGYDISSSNLVAQTITL